MANSRNPKTSATHRNEIQSLPPSKSREFFLSEGLPIELEEKYLTLVENAPDIIFVIDLNGRILYINKTAQKVTGYPLSKIFKINLKEFVAPEYHDSVKKILHKLADGSPISFYEVEAISANENRLSLEIHIKPIKGPKGRIIAFQGIARDLSERKKLEEVLRESEKKYSTLVEKEKDGVAIVQDGICKFANKAVEEISGYSLEELVGHPIFDKIHPKDKKLLADRSKGRIAGKKVPSVYQARILCKDRKIKDIEISTALIAYKGKPADLVMVRDLSERKKAEEKIKEMSRQVERFSEISADILSTEDEEELFNRIAQAVVDISDFNRVLISYFTDKPPYREIIGHKGVRAEDLKRVIKVKMPRRKYLKYFDQGIKIGNQSCYIPHSLKDILDQKAVIPGEKIYPEKEGSWHREDNLLVSMKDTKGQVIGIISVDDSKTGLVPTDETVRPLEIYANLISEIIQRRKLVKKIKDSEEKYRDLISNIKVGVFRATQEGEILEANPSALELFGYTCGEKFLELKIKDLYENRQDHEKFMKEIEKKGLVRNKEYLLRKQDGVSFWASMTSTAVKDISGQIVYYDTVVEDVTERRKLEEEVKRLSVTDELTGLYNRRYFNEHLPEEIKTAEKWRSTLSLIMIDIDDFKPYNDNFHHLKGDEVIKEVAQVISQKIRRDKDWASRFGGDEFAIILPGTDPSEATAIAERIREAFHNIKFNPEGNAIHKTISMGVSYCYYHDTRPKKHVDGYQKDYEHIATDLTNLADKALFRAKKSGKNKVFVTKNPIELSRMP